MRNHSSDWKKPPDLILSFSSMELKDSKDALVILIFINYCFDVINDELAQDCSETRETQRR